jgi:hypothetical protein
MFNGYTNSYSSTAYNPAQSHTALHLTTTAHRFVALPPSPRIAQFPGREQNSPNSLLERLD